MRDLAQKWQGQAKSEIQRRLWDGRALDYQKRTVPSVQDNVFLQKILGMQKGLQPLENEQKNLGWVLDIGCGAGLYSLALAPYAKLVQGIDISEKMIEFAHEKKKEHAVRNTNFACIDWADVDLQLAGLYKAFDVVFAHMTPAIYDYASFDKLVQASRQRCLYVTNTRRKDKILDKALSLVGIDGQQHERDQHVPYIFEYLWKKGYSPDVDFRKEEWKNAYSVQEMTNWCIDRAKLYRTVSKTDEKHIADFVLGEAQDGMVREEISVTIVTFDWHV